VNYLSRLGMLLTETNRQIRKETLPKRQWKTRNQNHCLLAKLTSTRCMVFSTMLVAASNCTHKRTQNFLKFLGKFTGLLSKFWRGYQKLTKYDPRKD